MNLLIIEDELALSRNISSYLQKNLYDCDTADTYSTAKTKLRDGHYDCIILDIGLPGGSGLDLLRQLKEERQAEGVLILSARNELSDKLTGLELGADDYLTKPFHLAELTARVNAIIRRRAFEGNNTVILGQLTIDLIAKAARTATTELNLTRKEYELLIYFASNKNKVITRESIVDHIWPGLAQMTDNFDFIYSHIKNLRKKLEEANCPEYIKSVYGIGYRCSAD